VLSKPYFWSKRILRAFYDCSTIKTSLQYFNVLSICLARRVVFFIFQWRIKLWTTRYLPIKVSLTGRSGTVWNSLPTSYFPQLRHVNDYHMVCNGKENHNSDGWLRIIHHPWIVSKQRNRSRNFIPNCWASRKTEMNIIHDNNKTHWKRKFIAVQHKGSVPSEVSNCAVPPDQMSREISFPCTWNSRKHWTSKDKENLLGLCYLNYKCVFCLYFGRILHFF